MKQKPDPIKIGDLMRYVSPTTKVEWVGMVTRISGEYDGEFTWWSTEGEVVRWGSLGTAREYRARHRSWWKRESEKKK